MMKTRIPQRRPSQTPSSGASTDLQFERFLFFSDAVFAIAITLLIIDVRLPAERLTSDAALREALIGLLPNYVGFLISFIVIGQFWVGHRRLFRSKLECSGWTILANMTLLFSIAFLPFPTAVVNAYGGSTTAVVFYGAWLVFAGVANMWLVVVVQRERTVDTSVSSIDHQAARYRAIIPIVTGLSGIIAGVLYPPAGVLALTISPAFFGPLIAWYLRKRRRQMFGGQAR